MRISVLEKFARHAKVLHGDSRGMWNRFATKGMPSTNNLPQEEAKTPSFQASPYKPLYPKQPKTNDVKPSTKSTSKEDTSFKDSLFDTRGGIVI